MASVFKPSEELPTINPNASHTLLKCPGCGERKHRDLHRTENGFRCGDCLSAVESKLDPPPDIRKEEASRMLEDALQRDDDMRKG